MSVIHVTQQIDSDTLHLPELRPLIGKHVEITIRELAQPTAADDSRWAALEAVAGKDLIEPEAYREYREFDKQSQRLEPL